MTNSLTRSINLWQLIFYGVGSIVGAGIYSIIGSAADIAGNSLWISFLFAAFAAFITALSYAELSSAIPKVGAEYQFFKVAFPKLPSIAFITGCLIALTISATCATVALAFGGYLKNFISIPVFVSAFFLLAFTTAINIAGIKQSTWAGIIMICVEVAGLILIIFYGFTHGDISRPFADVKNISFADSSKILTTTALVFFTYTGFQDIVNLSEESHQPTKNIPRALTISVFITTALFILVAISAVALVPAEKLAGSDSPLVSAVKNPLIAILIGIAALFATASTALISYISASRLLFGMGRDGNMPKILGKLLPKRKTPWVAALFLFLISVLLIPLGEVRIVAGISSFGVLLIFAMVHLSVIILRYKKPNISRPFTVPLNIGKMPLLPILGIIICLTLATQFQPIVYGISSGIIFMGVIVYLIMRARKG